MTSEEKQAYWRKYATQTARYERNGAIAFRRAIADTVKPVAEYANKYGAQATLIALDGLINRKAIEDAFIKFYLYVGTTHKSWTDKDIKSRLPKQKDRQMPPNIPLVDIAPVDASFGINYFNPRWLQRLKRLVYGVEAVQRVSSIANTLKKKLRAILGRAVKEEVRPSIIAARIVNESGGKFSEARAKLIARTETTYISNMAAKESAKEAADRVGLLLDKYWIHTQDDLVRDLHKEVPELIAFDEKFKIGDKYMDKPGDPEGGPENCCNCRCCVAYIPRITDEDIFRATNIR